jgi:hypothetical protein
MYRVLERALDRLAAATGIDRVRGADKHRFARHGDPAARRERERARAEEVRERSKRILP